MSNIARLFWVLSILGAAVGGANFVMSYVMHQGEQVSAPQLAALAAECLVYAVIPYVFARSFDEATRRRDDAPAVQKAA